MSKKPPGWPICQSGLAHLRAMANLDQSTIAAALKLVEPTRAWTQMRVSDVERGKLLPPSGPTLRVWCRLLGLNINETNQMLERCGSLDQQYVDEVNERINFVANSYEVKLESVTALLNAEVRRNESLMKEHARLRKALGIDIWEDVDG